MAAIFRPELQNLGVPQCVAGVALADGRQGVEAAMARLRDIT
jgi:hypothetical protein